MSYPRILIVDDSPFDRMILNRAFDDTAPDGFKLTEAVSAADAVEKLKSAEFEAVFLDVNMPGENGFAVLDSIRSMDRKAWPFVFMLSSSTHPDDINQAYSSMATAYLSKPTDLVAMREIAATCLSLIQKCEKPAA